MAYRELELSLLSAQELKNVNLITRMDVYAVVSISGDPLTRQCTAPDTYGGRNPCWNATFRFAVPPTAAAAAGASLHVLLRAERFLGDRDVGEVVVPLADILAGATGAGPQAPQVASYQVRKLHRWEPRGVLNVSYRLGPVVAPVVVERGPDNKAANFTAYAPVGVPQQPSHHPPSAVAYPPALPAPGRPAVRVAEHGDEAAAQNKSPVMAYPVGVPQHATHPPAKPDAYRTTASPPRPAAVETARHEAARAPAPAPAPSPTNARNDGLGQAGPTHVYMGPHTQIIFSTTTAGLPTRTTSPARSIIGPAGKKGDGNYASAAESMSVSVISPRSRKEDRWMPSVLSQSQSHHDTEQQEAGAGSSPVAPASHRLAASPFSSRSSSFSSSPLSPYSSSAHPSPYSYSTPSRPSTTTSPRPPPAVSDHAEVTHGTNNTSRGAAISPIVPNHSRGTAVSSPLPSSSAPMVPNHSRGAAVSSPLPSSSSPLVQNHSSVVLSPSTHP